MLTHAIVKKISRTFATSGARARRTAAVPRTDLKRARDRMWKFRSNPTAHTHEEDTDGQDQESPQILDRVTGDDPILRARIVEEVMSSRISRMVYDARAQAGLTQKELARRIGTHQSVIARLEDADYRGHSLALSNRIAIALGRSFRITVNPHKEHARLA